MSIRNEAGGGVVLGSLILAVGIAIGALAHPARWKDARALAEPVHSGALAANLVAGWAGCVDERFEKCQGFGAHGANMKFKVRSSKFKVQSQVGRGYRRASFAASA